MSPARKDTSGSKSPKASISKKAAGARPSGKEKPGGKKPKSETSKPKSSKAAGSKNAMAPEIEVDEFVEIKIEETTVEVFVAPAAKSFDDDDDDPALAAIEAEAEDAAAVDSNRPKDFVGPLGSVRSEVMLVARAKYSVATDPDRVTVSRPRKRDPLHPRTYRFSLKGMEIARRHMAGRSVTLADATELIKKVKVPELEGLEGEARKVATRFLLVALASRKVPSSDPNSQLREATLDKDGDLILVRVPFIRADLE